jgi:hypothetical protein
MYQDVTTALRAAYDQAAEDRDKREIAPWKAELRSDTSLSISTIRSKKQQAGILSCAISGASTCRMTTDQACTTGD